MRKIWIIAIMSVLAIGAVTPVFAGKASPHFIGDPNVSISTSTGLTVSWKAAGLDDLPTGARLTAAEVSATWQCRNHGGNIAPGQPLVLQDVVGPITPITPRNGQITFTVNLPPPPTPDPAVSCPNKNWTVEILSLTYTGVEVDILQNGTVILNASLGNFSTP